MTGSLYLLLLVAIGARAFDLVQYGAFLPSATYSVANQLGFFATNNLSVQYNQVPNSTAAFNGILSGQYDILTATVDNALNYRFNQKKNVTVLGQLDQGPGLVLASVPSITDISQLKGKPIIVDSPVSGYAYLLRKVFSSAGLELDNNDYYFMTVGGTAARYAALIDGKLPNGKEAYATILTYPVTAQGQALPAAPNILQHVSDLVCPITSSAFMIRQEANPIRNSKLIRFIQSMYAANKFLLNPRNAKCAMDAIARQLNVSTTVAQAEYKTATDRNTGEVSPDGKFGVSSTGIRNVVAVRQQYGGFVGAGADFDFDTALQPGPGQLIDYTIRDAAIRAETVRPLNSGCRSSCHEQGRYKVD